MVEPTIPANVDEEARKRALERIHRVDYRCTHGYGDGLCECEPPAQPPEPPEFPVYIDAQGNEHAEY